MSGSVRRTVRRVLTPCAVAAGAIALTATSASAHHCYVPMYSLNGPQSSNWLVLTAEDAAADPEIAGFVAECEEAVDAGYDALRAAGLPVGIKIKESMTIGDPKGTGHHNPNGADGKGLEYFGDGSTLAFEMLETWLGAAASYDCG